MGRISSPPDPSMSSGPAACSGAACSGRVYIGTSNIFAGVWPPYLRCWAFLEDWKQHGWDFRSSWFQNTFCWAILLSWHAWLGRRRVVWSSSQPCSGAWSSGICHRYFLVWGFPPMVPDAVVCMAHWPLWVPPWSTARSVMLTVTGTDAEQIILWWKDSRWIMLTWPCNVWRELVFGASGGRNNCLIAVIYWAVNH